jgi:hypothetical protein
MGLDHSPIIVTDGLSLYADAVNTRSYVGSGTTVNGLVSGIGLTLVNGVGFGTTGTNYFILDGTNDNIPFYVPNPGSTLTIELWARIKSFSSNGMIFGFSLYDVWTANGRIGFNTAQADQYGISSTQVTNLGLLNQWKHYVFEMRSDVSYTNNKIYINSQNQSLSQLAGSENSSNRNFNNGSGRISSWLADNNYYIPMDIAQFKVYNRDLTATEIVQNYNATKKRYGL